MWKSLRLLIYLMIVEIPKACHFWNISGDVLLGIPLVLVLSLIRLLQVLQRVTVYWMFIDVLYLEKNLRIMLLWIKFLSFVVFGGKSSVLEVLDRSHRIDAEISCGVDYL